MIFRTLARSFLRARFINPHPALRIAVHRMALRRCMEYGRDCSAGLSSSELQVADSLSLLVHL